MWTLPVQLAFGSSFIIEGRPLGSEKVHGPALMRPVSSNYATVFGIPLKRGRFFTNRDTATSSSVAVISEAMARRFWPKGNPIGERNHRRQVPRAGFLPLRRARSSVLPVTCEMQG